MIGGLWFNWNETTVVCPDCGAAAQPIDRAEAVAGVGDLANRFATLTAPGAIPDSGPPAPLGVEVEASTAQVSGMLAAMASHLQRLSACGGDDFAGATHGFQEPAPGAGLFESAARLAWAIRVTTDPCWHRLSPSDGATAAELTWVALHRALHCLEDAQLTVNASAQLGRSLPAGTEGAR